MIEAEELDLVRRALVTLYNREWGWYGPLLQFQNSDRAHRRAWWDAAKSDPKLQPVVIEFIKERFLRCHGR